MDMGEWILIIGYLGVTTDKILSRLYPSFEGLLAAIIGENHDINCWNLCFSTTIAFRGTG